MSTSRTVSTLTRILAFGAVMSVASACATVTPGTGMNFKSSRPGLPFITPTHAELTSLPEPRGVIPAAVYNFRDRSGQYKPGPSNALSTAVTQGADSILMKALIDSRWFAAVERANLQNLLTERKILQTQSVEGSGGADAALPSVQAARIVFEGTIVSYDSNIRTGGSGLRLLGVGGSTKYREDRVAVNLRVVNVENGLVLHSVTSTKRLLSREITAGVFSYVDDDAILEGEAGFTTNEPSHVAITEAIESALIHIIAEGLTRNSWQLANDEEIAHPAFSHFVDASQRSLFLERRRALASAATERIERNERLAQRLERARSTLADGHAVDAHRARQKEARDERLRQQRLARRYEAQKRELRLAELAAEKRQAAVAPQVVPSAEQLVRGQASAILRAQADIQVQAARQAHDAARVAQQLIERQIATERAAAEQAVKVVPTGVEVVR